MERIVPPVEAPQGWWLQVTTASGATRFWIKGGRRHVLSTALGPTWIAHFQPEIFLAAPDGSFVPRGLDPRAEAVVRVELVPVPPDPGPGGDGD